MCCGVAGTALTPSRLMSRCGSSVSCGADDSAACSATSRYVRPAHAGTVRLSSDLLPHRSLQNSPGSLRNSIWQNLTRSCEGAMCAACEQSLLCWWLACCAAVVVCRCGRVCSVCAAWWCRCTTTWKPGSSLLGCAGRVGGRGRLAACWCSCCGTTPASHTQVRGGEQSVVFVRSGTPFMNDGRTLTGHLT